uniref:Uncharacterized protein n=1 Tax=Leersia perrieri TaxID=77586 RepID=A0A0D9WX15_9ORYZ
MKWRPILRLPPPLLSHLWRHVRHRNAVPRLRYLIDSRCYASDATNGATGEITAAQEDMGRRRALPAAKKNLFLLLEDRKNACSIHKAIRARADHGGRLRPELGMGGMHCLRLTDDDVDSFTHDDNLKKEEGRWPWPSSWFHPDDSSPISWSSDPSNIPLFSGLPFYVPDIAAHAVHPNGHTIFVSMREMCVRDNKFVVTFSCSTETGVWTRLGNWGLPFRGHGHHDGELGSWVGLHFARELARSDGRLCACRVVSAEPNPTEPGQLKVGKEKVFIRLPGWEHADAELVYMGGCSEYCLVELLRPKSDNDFDEECVGDGDNHFHVYHVVPGETFTTWQLVMFCKQQYKRNMENHISHLT